MPILDRKPPSAEEVANAKHEPLPTKAEAKPKTTRKKKDEE